MNSTARRVPGSPACRPGDSATDRKGSTPSHRRLGRLARGADHRTPDVPRVKCEAGKLYFLAELYEFSNLGEGARNHESSLCEEVAEGNG